MCPIMNIKIFSSVVPKNWEENGMGVEDTIPWRTATILSVGVAGSFMIWMET